MRRRSFNRNRSSRAAISPNTYIGGVAASLTSASDLALFLGISESNISDFKSNGVDITCTIHEEYMILNLFPENTIFYKDLEGKCISLAYEGHGFTVRNTVQELYFPNVLYHGRRYDSWRTYSSENILKVLYFPKLQKFGDSTGQELPYYQGTKIFYWSYQKNLTIYVPQVMQTNNNGGVEGDLAYVLTKQAKVSYITNSNAPAKILDLRYQNGAIQFTPPYSENGIKIYELYVNDFFIKTFLNNSETYPLQTGDKVDIHCLDIFYHRSISIIII